MENKTVEKKIINLLQILNKKTGQDINKTIQKELGIFIGLLNDILENKKFYYLYYSAESAILSLLTDNPNIEYAKKVKKRIINSIRSDKYIFRNIIFGKSPSSKVIIGLGTFLCILILILFFILKFRLMPEKLFEINTNHILTVILFGALGSIVSIMVRINDFSKKKDTESSVLFFTGFFKPVIGISFSLFVFASLKSEIIPIKLINSENEIFLFIVISFMAGFSERFVRDILEKAKKNINMTGNDNPGETEIES